MLLYNTFLWGFFKRIAALLLLFKFSDVGINVLFIDVHLKSGSRFLFVVFLVIDFCFVVVELMLNSCRRPSCIYVDVVLNSCMFIYITLKCVTFLSCEETTMMMGVYSWHHRIKKEIPLSSRSAAQWTNIFVKLSD